MARETLKQARKAARMTQQQAADAVGINERYYKSLESGERLGAIWIWDSLETLFGVHQRTLREISENRHDKEDNQQTH